MIGEPYKVGCVFSMSISSEFRLRQYRDDGHRENAPHFTYPENKTQVGMTHTVRLVIHWTFSNGYRNSKVVLETFR